MQYTDSYSPVGYEYREEIQAQIARGTKGKVFFWSGQEQVGEAIGQAIDLKEIPGQGLFLVLDGGEQIRIDKIITMFGKIGAAYDEYDSFANQCLSCKAGVPE